MSLSTGVEERVGDFASASVRSADIIKIEDHDLFMLNRSADDRGYELRHVKLP
jgi:hypothetical protein